MDVKEKDFVFSNLIAYIGNKRRLIPLIEKAIETIQTQGSQTLKEHGTFIDYFSGSGVVAKMAKSLGFKVIANDIEYYSYILNKIPIEHGNDFLEEFEQDGKLDAVLTLLNSMNEYEPKNTYIANFYCPKDDRNPDVINERMFYTRENGILIDNMRNAIDDFLKKKIINEDQHTYLLSLLLYKASVHSNTSGVFKAFHCGFGGKKADALSRICKTIELQISPLSNNNIAGKMYNMDALKLADNLKNQQADIVYLDPPYNQHQYGSNYHLLNTIAKNDKPKVNSSFFIDGKKVDKSAIRKDWVKTKSNFCYKESAIRDFEKMIHLINSKYILISYSTEGIIDFDTLVSVLKEKGKLGIVTSSYTRYRGGRQSVITTKDNIEFILIVDTSSKSNEKDIENIHSILLENQLQNLFEQFVPVHTRDIVQTNGHQVQLTVNKQQLLFPLTTKGSIQLDMKKLNTPHFNQKKTLFDELLNLLSTNVDEKIKNIILTLKLNDTFYDMEYLKKEVIVLFNKINPVKDKELYEETKQLLLENSNLITLTDLKKVVATKEPS